MALGLKAKVALSVGSLSAIGAGGVFASHMLAGDTIADHLKNLVLQFLKMKILNEEKY